MTHTTYNRGDTFAIYCYAVGEEKGINWAEYVHYCPMCGKELDQ